MLQQTVVKLENLKYHVGDCGGEVLISFVFLPSCQDSLLAKSVPIADIA